MGLIYLDRPQLGWFALDVMQCEEHGRDWVALMIDVDPCDFPALFYEARQRWLRIPGKHRNKDTAWDALENMIATRH